MKTNHSFLSCQIEALKYQRRIDFQKKSNKEYQYARRKKILDEICSHMVPTFEFWDYDKCLIEAQKYKTKHEFQKKSNSAYQHALRKKFLDEICEHMVDVLEYWTFDKCFNIAKKYDNRKDFFNNNKRAYWASLENGWYYEVTKHMKYLGNLKKRKVYEFIFEDGCVYVGLTCNVESRLNSHITRKESPVYKHIEKTKSKYQFLVITPDFITSEDAQKLEDERIKYYESINKQLLNIKPAGGLGSISHIKWSEEYVLNECLGKNRREILKNKPLIQAAYRFKIMDKVRELCPKTETYTKEFLIDLTKKCSHHSDLENKYYHYIRAKKWDKELFAHFTEKPKKSMFSDEVISDCVNSNLTYKELSEKWGISQGSVTNIKKNYKVYLEKNCKQNSK